MARRLGAVARSPLFFLGLLLVASTAARAAWISTPPTVAGDERYYVSAARYIAGLPPVADQFYEKGTSGRDPNAEHPPLGKVLIATSMRLLGDRALAWRLPAVVFGTLAVAAMFWLARSAGGGPWEALLAAALLAVDNLFLVYGRLSTLDIMFPVFMLAGLALYLRGRPGLAGVVLGVGACVKLVALSALAVVVVIELLRWAQRRRAVRDQRFAAPAAALGLAGVGACLLATVTVYLALLGVLDRRYGQLPDPIAHTRSMLDYAEITTFQVEAQVRGTMAQGALAPVSKPWQWLVNSGAFSAHTVRAAPVGQPGYERLLMELQVRSSPFLLVLVVPAFLLAAYRAWADTDAVATVAAAWVATTFGLLVLVALRERVGYLYYMISVLPGVHLAVARLIARERVPRPATMAYGVFAAASVVSMYPFRTWAGK